MKSVWLVALLAALSATTMMITTDSAMARRGVHAGVHGVHVGNINRHPGWRGNYAGWRGGNWRRVGWGRVDRAVQTSTSGHKDLGPTRRVGDPVEN
jgi:hypothetical protein